MDLPRSSKQSRGLTAIDGAMSLIAVLLIIQIWLLTATLDAYLAGSGEVALAGAIVSGLCFAGCAVLYIFVGRVEHDSKK